MSSPPDAPPPTLLPRWALAASLGVFALQCFAFHGVRRDDAFITYRYAQNLIEGHGLVFNLGEKLMGSTSPGHVLLSALAYALVGRDALPSVMSALGCVGWTAQALAFGALLQRALGPRSAFLIALAVGVGAARSAEFVALETNLVTALLLWAFAMALVQRWFWAAALAALAGLFRPDMYLPATILVALCLWDLRARSLGPALLFVAISAPWYLFAAAYFGTVLPQSAAAKYQRTSTLEYAVFEFKLPASMALPFGPSLLLHVCSWLLAAVGAAYLARRQRLWILPLYAVLHYAAYLYLRPYMHHWHLYPANSIVVVLALVALATCLGLVARLPRLSRVGATAVALIALGYAYHAADFARTHHTAFWFGARDRVYQQVSRYLRTHARPTDVVASVEVGTIGYYTGLRMYDWGAIVTRKPEYRPIEPRLSWSVVDRGFEDRLAVGLTATRKFEAGEFIVSVHSFDLMREAALRVVAAQPTTTATQLHSHKRPEFERELERLASALEHSKKPIDLFLHDLRR
jgi:hypothetical protein